MTRDTLEQAKELALSIDILDEILDTYKKQPDNKCFIRITLAGIDYTADGHLAKVIMEAVQAERDQLALEFGEL